MPTNGFIKLEFIIGFVFLTRAIVDGTINMPIIVGPSTHPPIIFLFQQPMELINHDGQQWKFQVVTIWIFFTTTHKYLLTRMVHFWTKNWVINDIFHSVFLYANFF